MIDKFLNKISRHENQWMICCLILWAIICLNTFDGLSMTLGGVERNMSPELIFLTGYIPLEYQGAFLIMISVIHAYGIGSRNKALDLSLIMGVVYYALWTFGIFYSWFFVGVQSLGLFSKSAFVCVLYLIIARYGPHPHARQ